VTAVTGPGGRRFELPGGLTPDVERAVIAALEQYFAPKDTRPSPWALAGRVDATAFGALQARRQARDPWRMAARSTFARRGVPTFAGRGDAR
jgi:hypothetical protein